MKNFLIITALTFPAGMFAQGNGNINLPAQAPQIQNVNYYDQIDINNDNNNIQTNLGNAQANPSAQVQRQQSSGSFFGSEGNDQTQEKPHCKDCDAVKKAIRESHASSGYYHGRSFSIKKWGNKFSGRMRIKMKKMFARRKKIRTSYEICFTWQ